MHACIHIYIYTYIYIYIYIYIYTYIYIYIYSSLVTYMRKGANGVPGQGHRSRVPLSRGRASSSGGFGCAASAAPKAGTYDVGSRALKNHLNRGFGGSESFRDLASRNFSCKRDLDLPHDIGTVCWNDG